MAICKLCEAEIWKDPTNKWVEIDTTSMGRLNFLEYCRNSSEPWRKHEPKEGSYFKLVDKFKILVTIIKNDEVISNWNLLPGASYEIKIGTDGDYYVTKTIELLKNS